MTTPPLTLADRLRAAADDVRDIITCLVYAWGNDHKDVGRLRRVRELLIESAALAAQEGWQDIASAPKDGTVVEGHGGVYFYRLDPSHTYPCMGTFKIKWDGDSWQDCKVKDRVVKPKHWIRPLPPPPTSETTK